MTADKKIIAVELKKIEDAPIGADGGEGTAFEEIDIIHEDTFTYENEDPEITDYKDVHGNIYYSSKKPGSIKVNFSIGKYSLKDKEKFQGGEYTAGAEGKPGEWKRGDDVPTIERTWRLTTMDDVVIIIPRGSVSASGKANEKAIGLAMVVTAMKPEKAGVSIERWLDGVEVVPEA